MAPGTEIRILPSRLAEFAMNPIFFLLSYLRCSGQYSENHRFRERTTPSYESRTGPAFLTGMARREVRKKVV